MAWSGIPRRRLWGRKGYPPAELTPTSRPHCNTTISLRRVTGPFNPKQYPDWETVRPGATLPRMPATASRSDTMHVTIEPGILYLGTPVVLISTVNEDGSFNLAPMSSAFFLGWRCVLGLAAVSKTPQNLMRTGECVL